MTMVQNYDNEDEMVTMVIKWLQRWQYKKWQGDGSDGNYDKMKV